MTREAAKKGNEIIILIEIAEKKHFKS